MEIAISDEIIQNNLFVKPRIHKMGMFQAISEMNYELSLE